MDTETAFTIVQSFGLNPAQKKHLAELLQGNEKTNRPRVPSVKAKVYQAAKKDFQKRLKNSFVVS